MTKDNESAMRELFEGVAYLIKEEIRKAPYDKTVNGLILAEINTSLYTVLINGKEYNLPKYGGNTITVNKIAKVMIPQNDMNLAFIF
ncbi:MAG: hypothetical protein WCO84_01460 [bacterium]